LHGDGVQLLLLPLTSVAVRVKVLAPTLLQSKLVTSKFSEAMAQLSLLPLSTWAGVMVALPLASN
jgi:hypothetical protein